MRYRSFQNALHLPGTKMELVPQSLPVDYGPRAADFTE